MLENDLGEFRLYYSSSGPKCSIAPEKLISEADRDKYNRSATMLLSGHKKEKPARDVQTPSYTNRMSMRDTIPTSVSWTNIKT
jgi:hypothetical protein